jgi:hypothetical protein
MVRFAHRPRKFSRPHLPSYRHARYGNGFAVLRFAAAPTGACRCAWRCVEGIGTGNILDRASRGFEATCGPHRTGNRFPIQRLPAKQAA